MRLDLLIQTGYRMHPLTRIPTLCKECAVTVINLQLASFTFDQDSTVNFDWSSDFEPGKFRSFRK